jgi:hypothetical protein
MRPKANPEKRPLLNVIVAYVHASLPHFNLQNCAGSCEVLKKYYKVPMLLNNHVTSLCA